MGDFFQSRLMDPEVSDSLLDGIVYAYLLDYVHGRLSRYRSHFVDHADLQRE